MHCAGRMLEARVVVSMRPRPSWHLHRDTTLKSNQASIKQEILNIPEQARCCHLLSFVGRLRTIDRRRPALREDSRRSRSRNDATLSITASRAKTTERRDGLHCPVPTWLGFRLIHAPRLRRQCRRHSVLRAWPAWLLSHLSGP